MPHAISSCEITCNIYDMIGFMKLGSVQLNNNEIGISSGNRVNSGIV